MSVGEAAGKAIGTIVDDQVGYYSDLTLWKIRIIGFIVSVTIGIVVYHVGKSKCGGTDGCPDAPDDCGLSKCADADYECKMSATKRCAEKTEPPVPPKCLEARKCHGTAVAYGVGAFMLGALVTGLVNILVAVEHGHGRALFEQAVAQALYPQNRRSERRMIGHGT